MFPRRDPGGGRRGGWHRDRARPTARDAAWRCRFARVSCSCAGSVQYLGDVNELHWNADALGAASLMHQTRAVGRDDVFGAGLRMVADLVVAHLGGNDLLEHREGAAEAAAFVRAGRPNELYPVNFGKQVDGLGEEWFVELGRTGMLEPTERAATVVQADPMRKSGPGKSVHLQDVVQEFDQLEGPRADLLDFVGLLYRVEIVPHVVDAAAGR